MRTRGEDMCTALEELKMQGIELEREDGKIYEAISVYQDFKLSEKEISKMLQEKFGLTPREVEGYLRKKYEYFNRIRTPVHPSDR